MTKYKRHPWPTDGATMKYVDRATDRLHRRVQHQGTLIRDLRKRLGYVEEFLKAGPHGSAYELFLSSKDEE